MGSLSDLPLSIIETILCLIPIQEAGRTSILSREWRYRWTKMPKLVFEEKTFQVSTVDGSKSSILEQERWEPHDTGSKLISAVSQVLSMHDGPLHEFTLSLVKSVQHVIIDHILTHLSRKTSIKKLELDFTYVETRSSISTRTLQDFLSSCPLLKTVILNIRATFISWSNGGPTFSKLLECLPVIETLSLSFKLIHMFEDCVYESIPRELPNPLFYLKYLSIHDVSFERQEELILACLIRSSPNLEKLKILDRGLWSVNYMERSSRVECYPGIMLEHLNELKIKNWTNDKTRIDFVKLILARAPVLKKVKIFGPYNNCRYAKFDISGYPSASPEVQIIVEGPI